MLGDISQTAKDECHKLPFHEVPGVVGFTETDRRGVGAKRREGDAESVFHGCRVLSGEDEKGLETEATDGCPTTVNVLYAPERVLKKWYKR